MRRALHHVFTILSALSLLLCVAMCAMWVRKPNPIIWGDGTAGIQYQLVASCGYVYLCTSSELRPLPPGARAGTMPYGEGWAALGIGQMQYVDVGLKADLKTLVPGTYGHHTETFVALPWLLLLTVLLPAWACARYLRKSFARRRAATGCCPTCGYDLRAHSAGDRCPECGAVPASSVVRERAAT